MERLILPSRAAYFGYESICNCSMLRELKLPSGFTQLDYAAVGGNERLEELVIPEGVTELNNSALIDNTGLRRIVLPSTLTAIWDHAFQHCSSLEDPSDPLPVKRSPRAGPGIQQHIIGAAGFGHFGVLHPSDAKRPDQWPVSHLPQTPDKASLSRYCDYMVVARALPKSSASRVTASTKPWM